MIAKDPTLEEVFGANGLLERRLKNFELRPSQLEMASEILDAITSGRHLCLEAGTGTGKTLAYLIPALFSRKRVVVSTATKNLQDQIFHKDIPFIREHLLPDLSVTYMKGRRNFLCLKRLHEWKPGVLPLGGLEDLRERIAMWAAASKTGDRSELDWISDNDPVWSSLDARSEICTGQRCSCIDRCFVTLMRQRAFQSDLVVVNHALFFASLALESDEIGKVLPDYAVLILDEAHEVEDIAAAHFGKRLSSFQFEEYGRDFRRVFGESDHLQASVAKMEDSAEVLFGSLPGGPGHYSLNFYRGPDGAPVDLRDELAHSYSILHNRLRLLSSELQLLEHRPDDWEPMVRRLENLSLLLDLVFQEEDPDQVYWFEKRKRGVFFHVTPIDVGRLLRDELFLRTEAVVLTSATLTTNGNFEYVRERLGVPDPVEVVVPGEFDYSEQTILYVPAQFPSPGSPQYFLRALRDTRNILEISDGHAFLLFTSFRQMDRMYEALSRNLPFPLLRQGEMPKNRLLSVFKETPQSVLCATSSFWQGVDVRGPALRAVVIDKLPFRVPTEPVVAARIHRLESQGENAFTRYTIPDAIITLKQGLGRLIRSRQDRGILAVLDSRLRTRRYGSAFLESLPNCPLTDNMIELRNFFEGGGSSVNGGT